jgi:ferric-dicitrate binding protein FerR (iron transport regulator)
MAHTPPPDTPGDEIADLLQLAGARRDPPQDAALRVRRAVHHEWQKIGRRRRHRVLVRSGIGLAAAAAVILFVLQRARLPEQPTIATDAETVGVVERLAGAATVEGPGRGGVDPLAAGRALVAGSTVRTALDGYAAFRLASGASVRLDAGTHVAVADSRTLQLERGAVYVDADVPGDTGIEVRTRFGIARDVGTRFEVRLSDSLLRVRVRNGRVRLEHQGLSFDAPPGTELAASGDAPLERRAVPLHGAIWEWTLRTAPAFAIEGRTLGAFLQWAEREGGWRVRFSDERLQQSAPSIVLHGSTEGLTPADALAVVLPTCGLRHRVAGDDIVIERQ